jgi:hypothetical protein
LRQVPQLDAVSFFNQVAWLTFSFGILLPMFSYLLIRPYSHLLSARKSVPQSFLGVSTAQYGVSFTPPRGSKPFLAQTSQVTSPSCVESFRKDAYAKLS